MMKSKLISVVLIFLFVLLTSCIDKEKDISTLELSQSNQKKVDRFMKFTERVSEEDENEIYNTFTEFNELLEEKNFDNLSELCANTPKMNRKITKLKRISEEQPERWSKALKSLKTIKPMAVGIRNDGTVKCLFTFTDYRSGNAQNDIDDYTFIKINDKWLIAKM